MSGKFLPIDPLHITPWSLFCGPPDQNTWMFTKSLIQEWLGRVFWYAAWCRCPMVYWCTHISPPQLLSTFFSSQADPSHLKERSLLPWSSFFPPIINLPFFVQGLLMATSERVTSVWRRSLEKSESSTGGECLHAAGFEYSDWWQHTVSVKLEAPTICNRPFAQLLPGLETGHPATVGQSPAYDFSVSNEQKAVLLVSVSGCSECDSCAGDWPTVTGCPVSSPG